jgi:hypothetical protein
MPLTDGQRAGKLARVQVNGLPLQYGTANVDMKTDDLDTTNFESEGYDQGTIGIVGCDIDFGGLFDAHRNPYDDPPGVYPRDDLGNVEIIENLFDNLGWIFPFMRVLSSKNGMLVRDRVTHECSGKSNGPFATPTGSV